MVVIDTVMAFREECQDYCNGTIEVVSDQASGYSYDGGLTFGPDGFRDDFCTGSYEVFIEDDNGCMGGPVNVFVGSPTPPEADFTAEPLIVDVFDPQVTFINTSTGNVASEWIFNTNEPFDISDETNPIYTFPDVPGLIPVQLTILDSLGCPDVIEKNIMVNDVLQIFVPTGFTPNEDGLNDLFRPVGNDIDPEFYSFVVYSRWGDEVYRSDTYPHAWNGSLNNKKEYYMPDGYYSWSLTTKSKTTTEKISLNGSIMIAR